MNPQKTTVDWLRFRVQTEPRDVLAAMRPMYGEQGEWLNIQPLARGMLGFQQAVEIRLAQVPIGRMDFGGDSQRGWVRVDITGKGCGWVEDWGQVGALEDLPSAEVRRLDVALTTWKGEMTHDQVVEAHKAGRFITRGRPPELQQRISSNPRAGRTCEIGTREKAPKFMRCYEKGFEMCSKLEARHGMTFCKIDGFNTEDIYRCEVELKAVGLNPISWDVIDRRDQYFAGAYPFCADILPGVEADILQRRPARQPQLDLKAALANLKIQFGPTLYTALHAYHGDMTAVWDKVIGDHHSLPLVEAGVLLVDHD